MKKSCPNCEHPETESFYHVPNVPVHSVLLMQSAQEATQYTKRDIELFHCPNCGFVFNGVFEADVQEYSSKIEETQGFSDTFNKFHRQLAERLVDRYDLHDKTVLEIGCGKGEFISMVCEIGKNKGYGFDPAFIPARNPDKENRVEFVTDFYSEAYSNYKADFVCCKMTLEHIPDTGRFLQVVRNAIGDNLDTTIFFQIPEAGGVFKDLGFWDVYYEHCSYFSPSSLEFLFRRTGFEVLDIATEYDDQYLTIEAKPVPADQAAQPFEVDLTSISTSVDYYKSHIEGLLKEWKELINSYVDQGKKVVLWGGGSKAVAFLTTLGISQDIKYAVDINPYKHGYYLPGSGQKVIAPADLVEYQPDLVLLMNPIYTEEVRKELQSHGLDPEMLPIDFLSKKQPDFQQ